MKPKAIPFNNIPTKQLKEVTGVISEPLRDIWNSEILGKNKFASKLKLADLAPIHKKLATITTGNYRPVSVLPVVSKVFERIMDKQTSEYMEKYLLPYLCGYRKGYNCQHALLIMVERWKQSLDRGGIAGGILMDLSKAFDTINHQLLIAKLHAYGFDLASLEIIMDYLSDRLQRTKINSSFSTWSEILCGAPQGSVLGPKFFNINMNDLFFMAIVSSICNMADDTTPYICDMDLSSLIRNLESDAASIIFWFQANFMIPNPDKCHFLIAGVREQCHIQVAEQIIWESKEEKLLGVTIDKKLKFDTHVKNMCKKASAKVTALSRLARVIGFQKKRILMSAFIESQFSYCPLLWMFCSKALDREINNIQKRALRMVYLDYTSTFEELLRKDNSVTIHQRNIQLVAIEMFKVVKGIGPEIMRSLFIFDDNDRNDTTFLRPNIKNLYTGKESLRYFGTVVWDSMLPKNLKGIETFDKFKAEVKKWIPDNCPCRLCIL